MLRALLAAIAITAAGSGMQAAELPSAGPRIGIHYFSWFGAGGCSGDNVWNFYGDRPFNADAVSLTAGSLVHPSYSSGWCYESLDTTTNPASVHAPLLRELGVDFLIFDQTNLSKMFMPANNFEFQGAKNAVAGLNGYSQKKIKYAFLLSLTCWAEQCWGRENPPPGVPDMYNSDCVDPSNFHQEIFIGSDATFAESHVKAHIADIAALETQYGQRNLVVDSKPLLLFYVNGGSNVRTSCTNPSSAFANYRPSTSEWNPYIAMPGGGGFWLRDHFTVRFLVANFSSSKDYASIASDIWPYRCEQGCTTTEAGADAALYFSPGGNRRVDGTNGFNARVAAANSASRPFIAVRAWNEFSGGDEEVVPSSAGGPLARAWTIEPNTVLHQFDGSPNAWHFFNEVKKTLNSVKAYRVMAKHSGRCLTVDGNSSAFGAQMMQAQCGSPLPKNQIFYVRSLGAGNDWKIVPAHNDGMCVDVRMYSTPSETQDGAVIQQYYCQSGDPSNEVFELEPTGVENEYEIRTKTTTPRKCLDVVGAVTNADAYVQQYQCLGTSNQKWILEPLYR